MKKRWYDYLWIASSVYFLLGFVNILFAWLGLVCFFLPLIISVAGGGKAYCNRYCGRGQLFALLGGRLGLSRKKDPPKFLRGRTGLTSGGKAALDDKAAVAVGLSRGNSCSVGGSVFLWFLQHNAHIHRPGNHHYGFL